MKGVTINIPFVKEASRMEILYRIGYGILYVILGTIAGLALYVLYTLQFLLVLILGARNDMIHKLFSAIFAWMYIYSAYMLFLTDERPPFIPNF